MAAKISIYWLVGPSYIFINVFEAFETGPYHSIYKKLFERNRCNHRDYQNLGGTIEGLEFANFLSVNGCRSASMAANVTRTLARNQTTDYPALVFFELIGNDVCHPNHTLDAMTTPEDFTTNILGNNDMECNSDRCKQLRWTI